MKKILRSLKKGEKVTPGPQNGRVSCEPLGVSFFPYFNFFFFLLSSSFFYLSFFFFLIF